MKENKYDDSSFFNKYKQMPRSVEGLKSAGEWHEFEKMLPDLMNKRVLDLGCGFGWHCRYAIEHGARSATGIDISERMLEEAKRNTKYKSIEYVNMPIEDINYQDNTFDIVLSSLAFHYIKSCDEVFNKVSACLKTGGNFIFSVEHPIFTCNERQDWYYDEEGNVLHWPVDNYFEEGIRRANFLGEQVIKYHRTVANYINTLIKSGFEILEVCEPEPDPRLLNRSTAMKHELRRPMFIIISARKK